MPRVETLLAGIGFLLLAAIGTSPCSAADLHVRVSVKVMLDAQGRRPEAGFFHTDTLITRAVDEANAILDASGAAWRLDLQEIVDVRGAPGFFGADCHSALGDIEEAALAQTTLYQWRDNAINVYVAELADCRGYCSFPGSSDIVLINNSAWDISPAPLAADSLPDASQEALAGGYLWLHELGHYFNLCHTQGCCCGFACGTGQNPASSPRGGDSVDDTLEDLECWERDDIARWSFGVPYGELEAEDRMRVDDVQLNVMSYHRKAMFAEGRVVITPGQLDRAAVEMAPTGRRGHVVYFAGAPVLPDGPRFLRGDCNGDGDLGGVSDAVFLVAFTFLGQTRPPCLAACDANADGDVIAGTLSDAVYLLNFNFRTGAPPAAPYPDCDSGGGRDQAIGCKRQGCSGR